MTARLTAALRQAPATVPALTALALFIVWAADQAGYPVTHWGPGALVILVLLGIALAFVPLHTRELPRTVLVAIAALVGYTGLSFLSILWAGVPGDAWEGANRTLLYLLVFVLFAAWPQRGASAALLLCTWTLALIALALFTALHLDAARASHLTVLFADGRLQYPSGYVNAGAAQWLMAFWPAVLLARSDRLPLALRALLAGGAVLLAEIALLSQSRGSLYATAVMIVLVFALLPGRVRTFAVLLPIALGVAVAAPVVLHVGDRLDAEGAVTHATVHSAVTASLVAAVAVGLLVAAGAAIETRRAFSVEARRRIHRGIAALALLCAVAVLAAGLALAGNPIGRAEEGWNSFKGGYQADAQTGSRLISGLGSNRYDFYRVALDEFLAHPLVGIGADNFEQEYLLHGRSEETPHYPHSVELRVLAQTGLLGAALALTGLGAALLAAWRALRRSDPLSAAVAAAALSGFAYWLVHGSFDWFWEFAGLGAPAFAMLGLSCALLPRRTAERGERRLGMRPRGGLLAAASVAFALVLAASLTAPWLSQLEVESAAGVWTKSPPSAYVRLEDAARLNPLSDEADVLAGNIALRYGDLERADHEFSLALRRDHGDAYATLERGAIASARGERAAALILLERALHLAPHEHLTSLALALVRRGERVDVNELNRAILVKAQQLA